MKNVKGKGVFSAPGDYIYFKSQVPLHQIPVGLKQWRYYDFGPKVVPPLICIPATAGSADVYYKQIMALSMKGYRVISVDIPRLWSHHEWVHGFEKFLDAIDVHHIHIYGTSLGGFLAQLFAQHRPRRVKSLVLSNTFLDTRTFASSMPWAPVVSWAPSFLLKRYVLTGIRDGPHEPFIADSVDFVVSQVERLSKDDLASRLTLTVESASVGPLPLPDASITIMDTNDYCAIPQELKDEVGERYPGARRAFIKSGGDFPFLSRPDEVNLYLQLHLRRVGVEPQPDMIQGAPKPTDVGNSSALKQREYDDHGSNDVGSSRDPSNSEQGDDNANNLPDNDEHEVKKLPKGNEDSCKGPLGGDEREDKDDPPGDNGGFPRGPSNNNEAKVAKEPTQDNAESSGAKNSGSTNSDDTPKDSETRLISSLPDDMIPSCSNEQWPGNHPAQLLNQDPQNLSAARMFSEYQLVFLSYVLPAYFRALHITCCVHSCRCR
ncbi:maspardin-like isoform X1 [Chenopodium quinoa]|uniref:maspardin-like isoform X1 n=1 Tax=Chenopodium quinoa TaxID=63459 RepID=UPI000B780341|nr:maspardin-like isoform X1 [Chenopodium quinoa]